ncbi:sporozoite protein essential for cell traversal [Plasmodium sp. gorilla clade G3]|nr:sporozoite protein essential for cell traversal [Plasmodium sp. gorilla clade G3]
MKIPICFLIILVLLKCVLSYNLNNDLSKNNNFSLNTYVRKDDAEDDSKNEVVDNIQKMVDDFSDDIGFVKTSMREVLLDTEASLEEVSDHVVQSISKYSLTIEEKLNLLDGLFEEFIENNKGLISNLSKRQQKLKRDKIKKVCDLILKKLKKLENMNKLIKYRIILKYGNKDNKKEMIQTLKNEESISDDFKNNLSNYETERNNDDIKEIELVNFISTNYDKFVFNLEDLNKELLMDLNTALS